MPKQTQDPFANVNTGTPDNPMWEEDDDADANFNFDNVAPPPTIAPGEYDGVIVSAEYKLSKSDQPMIEVYVRVSADDDSDGFKVPGWLSFAEKAAWGTVQNLSVIMGRQVSGRQNLRHVARDLLEQKVRVKVKVDPSDDGRGFPKVDRWYPVGSGSATGRASARSGSLV